MYVRSGIKKTGSGQLIFKNWSGGPVDDFFLKHNLNFPNLMNVNMQRWMPMQRFQPGGVRCWMSDDGSRLPAFQAWRKPGVGGWRGHIAYLEAIFTLNFF